MFVKALAVVALSLTLSAAQETAVLRIRVILADATGAAVPIPRAVFLISDNPATTAPRRVITATDGSASVRLKPGNYTIESDRPVAFGGSAYSWTQTLDVPLGRETAIDLTAKNADIEKLTTSGATAEGAAATGATEADSATILSKWHDSVVEIWTPTRHLSGFVIDSKGLIATSHHALGGATFVEVEFKTATDRFKIPGRVIADDRGTGTAIVAVEPQAISAIPVIAPGCGREAPAVRYDDEVSTIATPLLSGRDLADGVVMKINAQAIFADLRIQRDTTGGPVFTDSGELLGISAIDGDDDGRRRAEAWIVPIERMCEVIPAATKQLGATPPPKAVRLPIDPVVPADPKTAAAERTADPAGKRYQITTLPADNFDIALLTPKQARERDANDPRSDFANWSQYVREAPPVLLVRVSPQFEESFWKMLARGAASTQGMNLPPLKSFTSSFLKMRAYCGDAEVPPIHPFILEREVAEKKFIKEGLYVFELGAFGPKCGSVRFQMYSEKDPQKGDMKTVDPKLFEQVIKYNNELE